MSGVKIVSFNFYNVAVDLNQSEQNDLRKNARDRSDSDPLDRV